LGTSLSHSPDPLTVHCGRYRQFAKRAPADARVKLALDVLTEGIRRQADVPPLPPGHRC